MLYPYRNMVAMVILCGSLVLAGFFSPSSAYAKERKGTKEPSVVRLVESSPAMADATPKKLVRGGAWKQRLDTIVLGNPNRDLYRLRPEAELNNTLSVTERQEREDVARSEATRILTTWLLETETIRALRDMFEPFTRPIEVYQSVNGGYQTAYFGVAEEGGRPAQPEGSGARPVKVFGLSYSVTDTNRFSFRAEIYERFTIGLYDSNSFDLRYLIDNNSRIGILTEGNDEAYLVYSLSF